MGALICFDNLDDAWRYRAGVFDLMLYHSVIRHSSRDKLPNLFPDVEREISNYLSWVVPELYPVGKGSLGLIVFDRYPLDERREFLNAVRKGVDEIGAVTTEDEFGWDLADRDIYVGIGEELIDLMERSLAKSESEAESGHPETESS